MSQLTRMGTPDSLATMRFSSLILALLLVVQPCCRAASFGNTKGYRYVDLGDEGEPLFDALQFVLPDGSQGKQYQMNGTTLKSVFRLNSTTLIPEEQTGRYFDPRTGGCLIVPVSFDVENYTVRLGFAYQNYDGKNNYPTFTVTLQGVEVDLVSLERWESETAGDLETAPTGGGFNDAHYTEYIATVPSGAVQLCLIPAVVGGSEEPVASPILNVLEIVPMPADDGLVNKLRRFQDVHSPGGLILSLKHRMNLGGEDVVDSLNRSWHGEMDRSDWYSYQQEDIGVGHVNVSTTDPVDVTLMSSLPVKMLQTAWEGNGTGGNDLGISISYWAMDVEANPVVVRLFFAEVVGDAKPGERVFDAFMGQDAWDAGNTIGEIAAVDIVVNSTAGGGTDAGSGVLKAMFVAILGCVDVPPSNNYSTVWISLMAAPSSTRKPILNGVELWEVIRRGGEEDQAGVALCPIEAGVAPPPMTEEQSSDGTPTFVPSNTTNTASTANKGLTAGAIVGIVLAVLTGVALLVAVIILIRSRTNQPKQSMDFQRFESEVRLSEVGH